VNEPERQAKPSENPPVQNPDTPPQPRKRHPVLWAVGAVLILMIVMVVARRSPKAETQTGRGGRMGGSNAPLSVATAVVRKGDIGVYVNALGVVTPVYTVQVKSRVDGQLMTVNYKEGQMVKEGELLLEIDSRPYQAQLTQAEGQLARDKALLENARVDLDRYQTAFAKNAIPKQQLDTQVATVHQYEGAVKLDEGQVDNAKLQLAYSHITAPISGRLGLRLVDPGNIVHATDSNPLAVITQLQPITVVFSVAEDFLPEIQRQLNQGEKLEVQALDRSQQNKLATGTLLTIDNQIDTTTGTIKLKAEFPNEDGALFPNQFVNARLLVSTERNATLVPTVAIQRGAQGPFVYVVQTNQTVSMKPVTVGVTEGDTTSVEGIEPGEMVAADNFNRLQEGSKVAPRNGGGTPRPGGAMKTTHVAVGPAEAP
jgi:multidrug efflux system membrane fusion protein